MYTLIGTAKLNDVDLQAWLADALDRIADLPQTRLHELLPWSWKADRQQALAAQPSASAGSLPPDNHTDGQPSVTKIMANATYGTRGLHRRRTRRPPD